MPKKITNADAEALKFGRRLTELLAQHKRPRHGAGAYLARRYKVATVTANAWLNGEYKSGTDTARLIATDHGTTFDWLYFGAPLATEDQNTNPVSPDAARSMHPTLPRTRRVEIRGKAIMDKDGFWNGTQDDAGVGYVQWEAAADAFAIQVASDALDPVIKRGTIIVFDAQPLRAGEYAHLALIDGREAILEFLFSTDDQHAFQSIKARRRYTFRRDEIAVASGYGGQLPGHKRQT